MRNRARGEHNILGVTPYLYFKGLGKRQLRNGRTINVCESCLIRSLAGGLAGMRQSQKLWAAIRDAISTVYGSLKEDDIPPALDAPLETGPALPFYSPDLTGGGN